MVVEEGGGGSLSEGRPASWRRSRVSQAPRRGKEGSRVGLPSTSTSNCWEPGALRVPRGATGNRGLSSPSSEVPPPPLRTLRGNSSWN